MRIPINAIKSESIFTSGVYKDRIATSLEVASKYDFQAAQYLEKGNYIMAAHYAVLAQKYLSIASEAKREDMERAVLHI